MSDQTKRAIEDAVRSNHVSELLDGDAGKLSIMSGWLVFEVGEHTCGGYGPESGYAHEPGCGYEPVLRLSALPGWDGDRLAALEVANRGYRERAERAEALLASHARPVAACETAEGLRTPTEGAPAERGSESIVTAAHYGRTA